VAALFFSFSEDDMKANGLVFAALILLAGAIFFFLKLKKWEFSFEKTLENVEKKKQELLEASVQPVEQKELVSSEEKDALEKRITALQEGLDAEKEETEHLKDKYYLLLQEKEKGDEEARLLKEKLLERGLDLKIKEEELHTLVQEKENLKEKNANLHFEIRTLLKVGNSFVG